MTGDQQAAEMMASGVPEDAAYYWGTIIHALRQRVGHLEGFLALRQAGVSGPDEIEIWQHCGISHQKDAECIVCRALDPKRMEQDANGRLPEDDADCQRYGCEDRTHPMSR